MDTLTCKLNVVGEPPHPTMQGWTLTISTLFNVRIDNLSHIQRYGYGKWKYIQQWDWQIKVMRWWDWCI
jgi:hypothetical protein